ncbi:partial Toxin subunit YenC1, partial [Anaerolineae bacterium]
WGNKTASTGTVPQYGYTGREPDATGLVFYRARYYHPGIARFASRDPMGMADSVSPYAYVANNPVNYVDPTGEFLNFVGGAVANVAIGGAIRMATGGSFWDAGGIATDLAVGAVTSGAGALASLRYLRNVENAVTTGTRFTGSVQGVAQVTGNGANIDHGVRAVFEAQKLVKSQGGTAYLDTSISKLGITGTAKNYVPDVTHLADAGRINTVEVASVSQQSGNARRYLDVKTNDIKNAVTSQGGSFEGKVIEYGDARVGVGEVFDAFYSGYVNGALAGYQGLKAFTASEPAVGAPYSGSFSGGVKLGK